MAVRLDDTDRKILAELQRDAGRRWTISPRR